MGASIRKILLVIFFAGSFLRCSAEEGGGAVCRFLPGEQGEITAWLLFPPLDEPDSKLEDVTQWPALSEKAEGADNRFRPLLGGSQPFLLSAGERKFQYIFSRVRAKFTQKAVVMVVSRSPFTLFTESSSCESSLSPKTHQHHAILPLALGSASTGVLVRFSPVAGEDILYSAAARAITSEGDEYPRGLEVELPCASTALQPFFDELSSRIRVSTTPFLLIPGRVQITLRWESGALLPVHGEELVLSLFGQQEELIAAALPISVPTVAILRSGFSADLTLPEITPPPSLFLQIKANAGILHRSSLLTRDEAESRLASERKTLHLGEQEQGEAFPLSRFSLLKAVESLQAIREGTGRQGAHQELIQALNELKDQTELYRKGKDPLRGRQGTVQGAYVSLVDGSIQPYELYIPRGIDEKEAMPLVVLLHGYVPSYHRTKWMKIGSEMAEAVEKAGMAMLLPFGRSNTDFLGPGERDVLDALEEVKKRYSIDPNRIYLAGYSMGGSGVWTLLTHYPGLFAAAHVWSGRTNYYFWHDLVRDSLPPYIQFAINGDNPVDLAENLTGVPIRVVHPLDDTLVSPGHTQVMARRLDTLGLAARLSVELPAQGGHWSFSDALGDPGTYQWFLSYSRDPSPLEITVTTFSPLYGKDRWLHIWELERYGDRAELTVRRQKGGRFEVVKSSNVAVFALRTEEFPSLLSTAPQPEITMDGWRILPASLEKQGWILVEREELPRVSGGRPRKNGILSGPVKVAMQEPFLLVLGTEGDQEAKELNQANALRFQEEWYEFAKGEARICTDQELEVADLERFHLLCFGSPDSHSLLKAVSGSLPFRFSPSMYAVGDHVVPRTPKADIGFVACYPNPQNPLKMLVIIDGAYYGDYLPINHKWDLVPDFLVFSKERGPRGTNQALLAGTFTSEWEVNDEEVYPASKNETGPALQAGGEAEH